MPVCNGFGIVFLDDSGNRYVLNSDRTWNYLFVAPGSSQSSNPAIYRDSNAANYLIYTDPTTGNKYVKNSDGTKTYINGFPDNTYGNPCSFNDAYGNIYTVYSDSEGNKYVIYSDPKGKYYLTNSGSKVYLPQAVPTGANPAGGSIPVVPGEATTPTGGAAGPLYIFIDNTGGTRYYLNSNGDRVYLTAGATSGNAQYFTDPQGKIYTLVR